MVAAEAAACGALPVVARRTRASPRYRATLARGACPEPARPWLSFPVGDGAVARPRRPHRRVAGRRPTTLRAATRDALVAVARERYSWDGVARGVIAAAEGRHDALPEPV